MCFEVYILRLMTDPSSKECPFMSVRANLIPSSQILSCQRNKTATSSTGRGQMATLYRQTEAVVFLLALSQFPYYPDRNWCVFGWEILVWDTISKEIGTAFASLLSLFWIPFSFHFCCCCYCSCPHFCLSFSSCLPVLFSSLPLCVLTLTSCSHICLLVLTFSWFLPFFPGYFLAFRFLLVSSLLPPFIGFCFPFFFAFLVFRFVHFLNLVFFNFVCVCPSLSWLCQHLCYEMKICIIWRLWYLLDT